MCETKFKLYYKIANVLNLHEAYLMYATAHDEIGTNPRVMKESTV